MRDLLAALNGAMASPGIASTPVTAVADLDLERYAGAWHEIARLPMYFQRKCTGNVTAHYTPNIDGTVTVVNRCGTEGGEIASQGIARRPEAFARGKLEVTFVPPWLRWLPPVWADYWVIALDGDYQWSMVGQPGRKYLWILSRTPSLNGATFARLKAVAVAMGYDLSALIVSGQVE
ncbi:MAG: lipocalin family protein [Luteibacter sp.]